MTTEPRAPLRSFPTTSPDTGVLRQVLSESPELMMVSFCFETGAKGALHQHPHVQSTYVHSGRFRFFLEGAAFDVSAGDSFVIPSNAEHGCECLEAGQLIDSFAPRRDDFL
ncbi:Cupin domain protein [Aquimixticola soesokkakensis]|uniref:Cupin domain protein n=1 Tax=Aquimixticola soesokkakensis TaxID=1519096 RepID=A0A1Y5RRE3_9RHOB|nr:cupin domain-containing protein [Aquimixticola soesokkakensis]SLN23476.1 Cupin domain protein [Aquimixticola soesokkakensis]